MVKVVEVCRVVPAPDHLPGSASSPESLPLTFFDLLWLRFPPVERLFFYQVSDSPNTSLHETIVPKLKHSLSLTLHHFLPLCGYVTWPQDSPKPVLNYVDGDSVSLTVAESDMDFHRLSCNDNFRDVMECRPLVPQLEVSHEKASVMALQVTVFPNSGFCIGITTHHAVLDGKTSISFVKSWAQVCKTESLCLGPELAPFYDRSVIEDPAGLDSIYANEWLTHRGPNNRSLMFWERPVLPDVVRGTFELTRQDIEKLKKSVGEQVKGSKVRTSTFAILCGYTWACLQKAKETKEEKLAAFVFNVDCRARLKPSVPPTYFGNCIRGRFLILETEQVGGENGVSVAVEAINGAIRELEDGLMNGAEKWASFIQTSDQKSRVKVTGVAGSPWFEVYKTDFGWGTPRKVEVASVDRTGAISHSDSKNGNGGVEIGVVLKPQEMEAFAALFAKGLHAPHANGST